MLGAQAVWLSVVFGVSVSALLAALAPQLVSLMGGDGQTADYAVTYLRIAAIGFPAAFLALGAQGYLRGVADLRTPLVILIAGNVANVILELLFVYGFDWGIEGSAWGTAIAQLGMGAAFVVVVLRRLEPGEARVRLGLARRVLSLGKWIFIRTTALMGAFVLAGAVAQPLLVDHACGRAELGGDVGERAAAHGQTAVGVLVRRAREHGEESVGHHGGQYPDARRRVAIGGTTEFRAVRCPRDQARRRSRPPAASAPPRV